MFPPFENASQFYPGLIVWCDPNSYDMEISTLAPNTIFDRKKARDLRPCLVVAVNQISESIQVARLCATTPMDTRRWVRVDSIPPITWKLNNAWLWVGTPPTVAMVINNAKVMHPHKDNYYSTPPIAAANLQNYWVHRQNYLNRGPGPSGYRTSRSPRPKTTSMQSTMPYLTPPGSTIYSSNSSPVQSPSAEVPGGMFGQVAPARTSHHGSSSTALPTRPPHIHQRRITGIVLRRIRLADLTHSPHSQSLSLQASLKRTPPGQAGGATPRRGGSGTRAMVYYLS
ncbi:hypothetical protein B0H11DRAFT_2000520, partial [Mycena galericulata]